MKYFISTGEASGDLHGAALIDAIKNMDQQATIEFLGGDKMARAAGHAPLIHYRDMAFMGFAEVLRHLGKVLGNLRHAKRRVSAMRPDVVVLIDYPSFNLKLAEYAHGLGIPVDYYIPPKVWAWKEWRVKDIRRYCRHVLSILPFEVEFYRRHGMEVEYVGNPSVEEVHARLLRLPGREQFLKQWHLPGDRPLLALVPGSRLGEIRNNLPVMEAVAESFRQFQPVVAGAPGIDRGVYEKYKVFPVVEGATFELVHHGECALVTSGTATLETALLGTPQVVCYRGSGSKLFYNVMKRVLKCPFVSLPNLIAGREVVPEMLMHMCEPNAVAAQLQKIVPEGAGRAEMLQGYELMRRRLGSGKAAGRAAAVICGEG